MALYKARRCKEDDESVGIPTWGTPLVGHAPKMRGGRGVRLGQVGRERERESEIWEGWG